MSTGILKGVLNAHKTDPGRPQNLIQEFK